MARIISRNKRNKNTKKSLKLLGGKPLFRAINQTGLTTEVTLRTALGINNAPGGGYIAANVTNFAIISTETLYGYVFRINLSRYQMKAPQPIQDLPRMLGSLAISIKLSTCSSTVKNDLFFCATLVEPSGPYSAFTKCE